MRLSIVSALCLAAVTHVQAQQRSTPPTRATRVPIGGSLAAMGSPVNPKGAVSWNRFYDHAGIGEICRRLAAGHPDRVHCGSIGKSTQGKDMWLLTVTNYRKSDPDKKPGMWIDGNTPSNEIQGSEI